MPEEPMMVEEVKQPEITPWNTIKDRDWFLARLVHIANRDGLELSISLSVGGSTITGTLISGGTFASEFAEIIDGNTPSGPDGEGVKERAMNVFRDALAVNEKTREAINEFEAGPPGYIHLRNAHWLLGDGKTLYNKGRYWRGRLSCVDGFSLGA